MRTAVKETSARNFIQKSTFVTKPFHLVHTGVGTTPILTSRENNGRF